MGSLREGSYKDINTLFDWIQRSPIWIRGRMMVTGGSYGGFMTLAVATSYNDRIRCSVDVVGPSNLVTFLETHQAIARICAAWNTATNAIPRCANFWNRSHR